MSDEMALLVADVFEAAGALRRSGEAIAATMGQTQARWQLLSVLSDGPRTVAQAARRLGIARQGVQRVANDLVGEDLATFQPNPDHRNSPLLELTPDGRHVLREITTRATESHRALAADFPPGEIAATRDLLRRLTHRVRQQQERSSSPSHEAP
ncbi:MarR family winged helix-turn-helix transcriptional regulator [Streptomyces silvisoli]|uniref:MarR family winged helix-turn-helix transcriptional regulator n=1 Tax=Streptomyces silvisoli TaxID=3034235 RepID=A0ABT5ZIP5_9ACTN|nr:MarR family winged helix-turn-helix transcriptional regulator [Streptomyces silvisoli]MDF3289687.1 MarR family winged helix-turn-helix transcriptional regulator [Streptomyces silvisoli]